MGKLGMALNNVSQSQTRVRSPPTTLASTASLSTTLRRRPSIQDIYDPRNIPNIDRGRTRFNKWHYAPKYFRGSSKETTWSQERCWGTKLGDEIRYREALEAGTHPSLAKFPWAPLSQSPQEPGLRRTWRPVTSHAASYVPAPDPTRETLRTLRDVGKTFIDGFSALRDSLHQTNGALDELARARARTHGFTRHAARTPMPRLHS